MGLKAEYCLDNVPSIQVQLRSLTPKLALPLLSRPKKYLNVYLIRQKILYSRMFKVFSNAKIDPVDLIKRSIEKEKAGNEFYTNMSEVIKDKECKKLLLNLARVEQIHENELRKLLG